MSPSNSSLLKHMLDEVDYLLKERQGLTEESFLANETCLRAFARSIEILGEAAKQLPDQFRESYPDIPWREIAGMRDRLIHAYFAVDYQLVWDVVENKIPELRGQLLQVLETEID
jgi:uncharacterized protein with HEPN domain